ncbi:MAG: hypothetical protein ABFQ53_03440 [Patescibacteria group bacterium]
MEESKEIYVKRMRERGVNRGVTEFAWEKKVEKVKLEEKIREIKFDYKTISPTFIKRVRRSSKQKTRKLSVLKNEISKLNKLIFTLESPQFNGGCTNCGDNLLLFSLELTNSTECIDCQKGLSM